MWFELAAGRWARVSDPAPGPTAGLLNCVSNQLGERTVITLNAGDLRSACVARSETGHSALRYA